MEDSIFIARRKKEEGKPFYLIPHGFMNMLYTHQHDQNPPLLVRPIVTATLQVSIDLGLDPSHKKNEKNVNPKVKISLIDSDMGTRKRKQSACRTS